MKYIADNSEIKLGDLVEVGQGVIGTIVCDYDNKTCLQGYQGYMVEMELVGGGCLSSGVMINTKQLGNLYYPEQDEDIKFIKHQPLPLFNNEIG